MCDLLIDYVFALSGSVLSVKSKKISFLSFFLQARRLLRCDRDVSKCHRSSAIDGIDK